MFLKPNTLQILWPLYWICLEGISSDMPKLEMAKISNLKKKTWWDEIQRANCFYLHCNFTVNKYKEIIGML